VIPGGPDHERGQGRMPGLWPIFDVRGPQPRCGLGSTGLALLVPQGPGSLLLEVPGAVCDREGPLPC